MAAAGSCDVAGGRHSTAVSLETTRPSGKSREKSRILTQA